MRELELANARKAHGQISFGPILYRTLWLDELSGGEEVKEVQAHLDASIPA
jgi:hypothetical protein